VPPEEIYDAGREDHEQDQGAAHHVQPASQDPASLGIRLAPADRSAGSDPPHPADQPAGHPRDPEQRTHHGLTRFFPSAPSLVEHRSAGEGRIHFFYIKLIE